MTWPPDPTVVPILLAVGWVIRAPLVSREEGHEAITRSAWDGLALTVEQREALIHGVRAPDISIAGLFVSLTPFGQARHALRAWSGSSTEAATRDIRAFLAATHLRALAGPNGAKRWKTFGELLHCLQDSYSPAHAERADGRILRVRHWGPVDLLRRSDEHGFPSDRRDGTWIDGALTDVARQAVEASRRYLEIVTNPDAGADAFAALLDDCVPVPDRRTTAKA